MLRHAIFVASLGLALTCHAEGFKFSDTEKDPDQDARKAKQAEQLSTPCRKTLKNQKIMVLIAERRNGVISAKQSQYNSHINFINDGLKSLGLKTYTQEQIRAQVAQAEIDAYFKNDPDAALAASKRMAANYVLRGVIETEARTNLAVNVNQVDVNMQFTLTAGNGRVISQASANNASFAGSNVAAVALDLVQENAQDVIAQLYSDYCKNAGKR